MIKIAIITGSRADYGLLCPLIKKMYDDDLIDLNLIATGSHLSKLHGNTIEIIKKDGFDISDIVDIDISGDEESDICKSISIGLQKFSNIFNKKELDGIIILGDRYELWSVCMAAVIHKIPIIHIHGGETTKGAVDDVIRHSITKMASIHFPSIEIYKKRIIQMGENPQKVYSVGALGIDNIKNMNLMDKEELLEYTGVNFNEPVALMTYHPVTLDKIEKSLLEVNEILEALLKTNLVTLITMPNADTGGNKVFDIIKTYEKMYPRKFILRKNLGQKGYLSAMKYAKLMIGNSSSGIIESASFHLPVVNIGERQAGRYKPSNVLDCDGSKKSIEHSIKKVLSEKFNEYISNIDNPYGDGQTAIRIINILKNIDFKDKLKLLKKDFYNLY